MITLTYDGKTNISICDALLQFDQAEIADMINPETGDILWAKKHLIPIMGLDMVQRIINQLLADEAVDFKGIADILINGIPKEFLTVPFDLNASRETLFPRAPMTAAEWATPIDE
jgi:hypothetical protein